MSLEATDLIFRTAGPWGAGKSANLDAPEVDLNFWVLLSALIELQTNPPQPVEIDRFDVVGNKLTIVMSSGASYGPFDLPVASLNFKEDGWQPETAYTTGDMFVGPDDVLYLVARPYTSLTDFDPDVADTQGTILKPLSISAPGSGVSNTIEFRFNVPGVVTDAVANGFDNVASYISNQNWQISSFDQCSARTINTPFTAAVYCPIYRGSDQIGRISWTTASAVGVFSLEASYSFPVSVGIGDVVSIGAPLSPDDDNPPVGNSGSGLVGLIVGEVIAV